MTEVAAGAGVGGDTFCRCDGPAGAPPLLLVHGVGLDHRMWDRLVPGLARERRVVRYDLLGHGASADPPGSRSLDDFVAQTIGVLDGVGADRAAVVGFSMGALIVQALAAVHPGRLERVAILNGVWRRTATERAAVAARLAAVEAHGPSAGAETAIARWFTPEWIATHADVADGIRTRLASHPGDGYAKAYRVFASGDGAVDEAALARLRCPVLVATGADDVGSTPAMAHALAAIIPGARCVVLDRARHMMPVERAAQVSALLREFLRAAEIRSAQVMR